MPTKRGVVQEYRKGYIIILLIIIYHLLSSTYVNASEFFDVAGKVQERGLLDFPYPPLPAFILTKPADPFFTG